MLQDVITINIIIIEEIGRRKQTHLSVCFNLLPSQLHNLTIGSEAKMYLRVGCYHRSLENIYSKLRTFFKTSQHKSYIVT